MSRPLAPPFFARGTDGNKNHKHIRTSLSFLLLIILTLSSCKKDCSLQDEQSDSYNVLSNSYAVSVLIWKSCEYRSGPSFPTVAHSWDCYYDFNDVSSYTLQVILGHDSLISKVHLTLVNTNANCDTTQPSGDVYNFIIDSRNFIREIDKTGYQTIWTAIKPL